MEFYWCFLLWTNWYFQFEDLEFITFWRDIDNWKTCIYNSLTLFLYCRQKKGLSIIITGNWFIYNYDYHDIIMIIFVIIMYITLMVLLLFEQHHFSQKRKKNHALDISIFIPLQIPPPPLPPSLYPSSFFPLQISPPSNYS